MRRLDGRVVATTRDGAPDDPLTTLLEREGASVRAWATLAFGPAEDPDNLRRAAAALDDYDWVVFTSARSAEAMSAAADPRAEAPRVAAVGEATAAALRDAGWRVDVTGDGDATALVDALARSADLAGARVLFPAASRAALTVEEGLGALGATVDRVEAYRTRLTPPDPTPVLGDLAAGVDVITFASPSAVASLAEALAARWPDAIDGCGCAAIGPTTRRALLDAGVDPVRVATAAPPSLPGLVDACVRLAEGNDPLTTTEITRSHP